MAINSPSTPVVPGRGDQDPTALTTQQINERITALREIIESRLHGIEDTARASHETIAARLDGMDKEAAERRIAVDLLQKRADSSPSIAQVNDAVAALREVQDTSINGQIAIVVEKIKSLSDVTTQQFKSIVDTFAEKDKAVSVGLSAQKESAAAQQASNTEATNKMESNFTKLLDQGRELLAETRKGTDLQINDLKTALGSIAARLDRGEGRTVATTEVRTDNRAVTNIAIAGAVAFVVVMTAIVGVVSFTLSRGTVAPQVIYVPPPVPTPNNVPPTVAR